MSVSGASSLPRWPRGSADRTFNQPLVDVFQDLINPVWITSLKDLFPDFDTSARICNSRGTPLPLLSRRRRGRHLAGVPQVVRNNSAPPFFQQFFLAQTLMGQRTQGSKLETLVVGRIRKCETTCSDSSPKSRYSIPRTAICTPGVRRGSKCFAEVFRELQGNRFSISDLQKHSAFAFPVADKTPNRPLISNFVRE
jgi:hypothetical protein